MDFKQELEKLSLQLIERKSHIINEESTKQALIIPFIQKLGFDVFNPLEVEPEYVSDFGIKKGEKVDYAIKKDRKPIIFVEAKSVNEKLHKHSSQIYRYFNATPEVRFSILTNGTEYKLFTDLKRDNIMDDDPFYEFNIESLTNLDIEVIEHFTKDEFDIDENIKFSQELVYTNNIHSTLKELFKNPSDDFVRFLIKDLNNQRVTSIVLEKFRPIIKKAINHTLLEIIGEGLSFTNVQANQPKEDILVSDQTMVKEGDKLEEDNDEITKPSILTTEEELRAFSIIKETLEVSGRVVENVKYKDNSSYFNIMNRVITKWFIRLYSDTENKNIITRLDTQAVDQLCPGFRVEESPKGMGKSRIYINSVEDLLQMKSLIIACYDEVSEESKITT
ncbi:type I restriction endonuclease [Fictibacillus norfolkensis]|uniref:Type I restriction enzyme HsdR N-terminal domain-containing protein n=1 Tax=Fictibacillus norfolkensis TaxID=2762233 RepID=A0ABR8SRZ6_9BACL|nr:type I restriction endonuclease [Fictibacillus norfolkensis]MBD7966273.1 type I restriction enzyme HsdR N-terminal domain-containing protein [Fictibacillus norfolkensis]